MSPQLRLRQSQRNALQSLFGAIVATFVVLVVIRAALPPADPWPTCSNVTTLEAQARGEVINTEDEPDTKEHKEAQEKLDRLVALAEKCDPQVAAPTDEFSEPPASATPVIVPAAMDQPPTTRPPTTTTATEPPATTIATQPPTTQAPMTTVTTAPPPATTVPTTPPSTVPEEPEPTTPPTQPPTTVPPTTTPEVPDTVPPTEEAVP